MVDRLDNALNFFSQALELRRTRQDVLASNIANSNTPGYKARDFDFNSALERAVSNQGTGTDGGLSLTETQPQHIAGQGPVDSRLDVEYEVPTQPAMDGNTVDMNRQRVKYMQNAIHYRSDLKLLGNSIRAMKTAMQPIR